MSGRKDFRVEAEERANRIRLEKLALEANTKAMSEARSSVHQQQTNPNFLDARMSDTLPSGLDNGGVLDSTSNASKDAALAEIDYKLNGSRARSNTGEFIPPRWIPDEEVDRCTRCKSEFDWVNRRHHCRHCGNIFCQNCSPNRSLLPFEYGLADPQRVCINCEILLRPIQSQLTSTIANHHRHNAIDITGQCSARYFNMPYSHDLAAEVRKASYSLHNLFNLDYIHDKAIPLNLLKNAKGIAFLTVLKVGIVLAPRVGTGLVIARLPDNTWSAPSAIGTFGVNWGFMAGANLTDYVIILNTYEAVEAFSGTGQISIGANIEVAAGPMGRAVDASFNIGTEGYAPAYSYSHTRGLFAGVGLEGSLVMSRPGMNYNFYGQQLDPKAILRGVVPPPRAATPLYDTLYHALSSGSVAEYDESYSATLPSQFADNDVFTRTAMSPNNIHSLQSNNNNMMRTTKEIQVDSDGKVSLNESVVQNMNHPAASRGNGEEQYLDEHDAHMDLTGGFFDIHHDDERKESTYY